MINVYKFSIINLGAPLVLQGGSVGTRLEKNHPHLLEIFFSFHDWIYHVII
jgi:hypothetical protein